MKTKGCSNFKSLIETDKLVTLDYEIYVEMTTFTRKNDNVGSAFEAEPGTNDDLVMCMVLFGWCVSSDYWNELTDTNVSKSIYDDKLEENNSEEYALGFQTSSVMSERIHDQSGDVWTVITDHNDPIIPDWYDEVYHSSNL